MRDTELFILMTVVASFVEVLNVTEGAITVGRSLGERRYRRLLIGCNDALVGR